MDVREQMAALSAEEIVRLARQYTLFEWSAQQAVDPIPVARAQGVYFYTPDGRRYLDFNSQLMSVNIGHADPRVIAAIGAQLAVLPYANPFMATAPRALLGQRLAARLPGDLEKVFFTNGGAEANENAIKLARLATGRHKIAVRYRSYHGATAGAMTLTGDPRRWANEPGIPGVIRIPDTQPWGAPEPLPAAQVLAETERVLQYEGPHTIAAILIEPVVGTNGILIPPEGYLQGLRALCDRYGILLIADEVMSGFGRTGAWVAVDHWGVVPDLLTMAKGLTSSYVPLGAVAMRRSIAAYFEDHVFAGGLTYNSHPLACAAALATLGVYEADGLIARAAAMGARMREHHLALQAAHPCVGAVRNIGLFGVIELVRRRSPYEPLAPYNGTSPEMAVLARALRDAGLYTFVRWNAISTNPPLTISEDELAEGFAIIDRALTLVDQMLAG